MSTAGARTGDPRRVAKRALAAALIAMLMWGVAAIASGRDHKSPGVRAGNSWSANMPMPEIDGVSWS